MSNGNQKEGFSGHVNNQGNQIANNGGQQENSDPGVNPDDAFFGVYQVHDVLFTVRNPSHPMLLNGIDPMFPVFAPPPNYSNQHPAWWNQQSFQRTLMTIPPLQRRHMAPDHVELNNMDEPAPNAMNGASSFASALFPLMRIPNGMTYRYGLRLPTAPAPVNDEHEYNNNTNNGSNAPNTRSRNSANSASPYIRFHLPK